MSKINLALRYCLLTLMTVLKLNCFADEEQKTQREWLTSTLSLLEEKFTFSTLSRQEMDNHALILSEVDTIVKLALESYPEELEVQISCIHLLYIQGNYYLSNDRAVVAQKKLLIAKKLCEQNLESLEIESAEYICEILRKIDNRLPSFYAQVLHLLGKSYIYPRDQQNQLQWTEGEALLIKAVEMQEYIEVHPGLFQDEIDKPAIQKSIIFKRLLGITSFEKNFLDKSGQIFLELMQEKDQLNQLCCLKYLIQICQRMGEAAESPALKQSFYKSSSDFSYQVLKLLDFFPNLDRISIYYSIIGNLYQDPSNPFRDLELALHFFEKAKHSNRSDLKSLQLLVHQGLTKIYAELSTFENTKAKHVEWDSSESASADFLKEINDKLERKVIAYEEMGDIYREKHEYILATALYSNGLSLLKHEMTEKAALLQKRLLNKMEQIEKELSPSLQCTHIGYSDLLTRYRNQLAYIRQETDSRLDQEPVEETYAFITKEYKQLLHTILNDAMHQSGHNKDNFTLIAGGSIAKGIVTPYSDVELAFLIDEESDVNDREHLKTLTALFTLRLIAIGETPIFYLKMPSLSWLSYDNSPSSNGFMLDPGQLAPFEFFLETPKEFARQLHHGSLSKNLSLMSLRSSFLNFDVITGNPDLASECKNEINHLFTENERDLISKDLLWKDFTRYNLKKQFYENGQGYSIKHDFYRPLTVILNNLAFKFWKRESKTPWSLIKDLQENAIIDERLANTSLDILNKIGQIRLKTYLQAHQQQELLTTNSPDNSTLRSYPIEEPLLININKSLAALQDHAKSLEPTCSPLITGLPCDQQVYLATLQLNDVYDYFQHAINADPLSSKLLKNFGLFLMILSENFKAQEMFEKCLQYTINPEEHAEILHYLGLVHLNTDNPEIAHSFLKSSLECYENILEPKNPVLSDIAIDFGRSLTELGKFEEGINLILKFVEIDTQFYERAHPMIAHDYYRLGLALKKGKHYHEAKSYFEKAIKIDRLFYGERHLRLANYYREIGICSVHLCDPMKAQEYFTLALKIDNYFFGNTHPNSIKDLAYTTAIPDEFVQQVEKNDPHFSHQNCIESKLAKSYREEHPVFKAEKLNRLGIKAMTQGNKQKADDYFKLSKIILASYYKKSI